MKYDDEYHKKDSYYGPKYGYSEKYGYDQYGECRKTLQLKAMEGVEMKAPWQLILVVTGPLRHHSSNSTAAGQGYCQQRLQMAQ